MATEKKKSVYDVLSAIDCSEHIEIKDIGKVKLSYLSWAWAWGILKKHYPNSTYKIYENANGMIYHTDGRSAWVKTGVTVEGIEYIECLPVMNNSNCSIALDKITSTDVNKAIQRSLTKAVARHGLGLYIYAGEDLPNDDKNTDTAESKIEVMVKNAKTMDELLSIWKSNTNLQSSLDFKQLFSQRKHELQDASA